ncbi:MAG TPA: hypothetical protein IAD14_00385 [Candidatus Coprousia avicola]|nr:hypothetical protein [Candidatus Coprousia avicola]
MAQEVYTGRLLFRNVQFQYAYQEGKLWLYPLTEQDAQTVRWKWLKKEVAPGSYVNGDPLVVHESYIDAQCNELRGGIVFITRVGSGISSVNCNLSIAVRFVVLKSGFSETICGLSISGPCLNHIYPSNIAWEERLDFDEMVNDGVTSIVTAGFESVTSNAFDLKIDKRDVTVSFTVGWTLSHRVDSPPITLRSLLLFEFEETDDYLFLCLLWSIAERFLGFMTHQVDVGPLIGNLKKRVESGKYLSFAEMMPAMCPAEFDDSHLSKGRYLTVSRLEGKEHRLFQDIVDNEIYLRHLVQSNRDKNHVDPARYVLVTAAFEWEFARCFPDGVEVSASQLKAEETVKRILEEQIQMTSGRVKSILGQLEKSVSFTNLMSKVVFAAKQYDEIVAKFGKRLYELNNVQFNYSDIGTRLARQRNNYAHGNIDKDFEGAALLDLFFLEYVILAMQLKSCGVSADGIRQSINVLFGLHCSL